MLHQELLKEVREALSTCADPKARESSSRFFKKGEEAKVYGVRAAEVNLIGREFYKQIKNYSKEDIFILCEELWKSGFLEEALIACRWSAAIYKRYEKDDFAIFEKWLTYYVNNWADCDTFCNHTMGSFLILFPEYTENLKKWAVSPNRWLRRGAAVSFIIPARKGMFLKEIFEIADILLSDTEDLVQKGYGWMLKAAAENNTIEVFNYILAKKDVMPRTALRYAIEKMPADLKAEAMNKKT